MEFAGLSEAVMLVVVLPPLAFIELVLDEAFPLVWALLDDDSFRCDSSTNAVGAVLLLLVFGACRRGTVLVDDIAVAMLVPPLLPFITVVLYE